MGLLSADDFLSKARELPFEDVPVPELGGSIRIRRMSGPDYEAWEEKVYGSSDKIPRSEFRAWTVAFSAVNENGERMFSDEQTKQLSEISGPLLIELFEVAARVNRLTKKDQDDAVKNSDGGQDA